MTPKGKKTLIVIGSLLAIGGVVGFILWKRKKGKKEEEQPQTTPDAGADQTSTTPNVTPSGGAGGGSTGGSGGYSSSNPDTLAFQKWYNKQGYTPKLTEDGVAGSKTNSAFKKYGDAFKKATATTSTAPSVDPKAWKKGDKVYLNGSQTALFSYPSTSYAVGRVQKKVFLDKPFGIYLEPATGNFVKVQVFGYEPNDPLTGGYSTLKTFPNGAVVFVSKYGIQKTPY